MSKINFPKKQEQRLIPKYLLEYSEELVKNHPDPSASWGGSGSTYTAGEGIVIENNEISVDTETIPTVASLSTVAFSGSYSDLSNTPDLSVYELKEDAFTGDYEDLTHKPDLSIYAETSDLGDCAYLDENELSIAYSQVTGTPTIPTNTSDLNNDSGFITSSALSGYATETWVGNQGYLTSVTWSDVSNKPTFATVATTGDYDDLTNKPNLANYVTTNTNQDVITGAKTFVGSKKIKFRQLQSGDKPGFTIYNYGSNEKGYLEYNPTDDGLYLGRYGNYRVNELGFKTSTASASHKLLVPNVTLSGNVTDYIPISVNGTKADSTGNITISTGGSYTAGTGIDITNNTISIDNTVALKTDIPTVPTNISAFTNDSGYITGIDSSMVITALGYTPGTSNFSGSYTDLTDKPDLSIYAETSDLATVATTGDYDDLLNKPTIPTVPTNVSAFTNDSGYITNTVNNLTNYTLSSNLATVATTGAYSDLSGTPTIPNINYVNGDTYANKESQQLFGYITNGGKDIQITVVTPKSLANISSITINKLEMVVRGVGGYVNGSSYIDYAAANSGYTLSYNISSDNYITITVRASSAYSGGTNNTPITAVIRNNIGSLSLTLNT